MPRYGRDYDRMERTWGRRGRMGGDWGFGSREDRGGIHARYDREFGSRGQGWGMEDLANQFWHGGARYERDYRTRPETRRRDSAQWTGMESNRYRGVYGSDYRVGERNSGEHGGYRGTGPYRGGGMNPGRQGGWR